MNSSTDLSAFKFSMPIPMRWNDMDLLGHVNNIYYFEYFQIARGEFLPAISAQWDWNKHMFVIAHLECDFLKEITIKNRNAEIKTRITSISKKSFEIEYLICSQAKDGSTTIHAKGKSVQVMVDMVAKKSIEIQDWLKADILAYHPELQ